LHIRWVVVATALQPVMLSPLAAGGALQTVAILQGRGSENFWMIDRTRPRFSLSVT
jgi:hypothetical protein